MTLDLFRKTTVVNIGHGTSFDVYVGRSGRGYQSQFGNPHSSAKPCPICSEPGKETWHTKAESLGEFRVYFIERIASDVEFRNAVLALRGKVLGCFCVRRDGTGHCHALIIAEWIDSQSDISSTNAV